MTLSTLVTMVRGQLESAAITGLPVVDARPPASPSEVPRITVSVDGAAASVRGLGRVPAPPMEGALRVGTSVDLTDPVLHLQGEDVDLLSDDRRVLQLPHGAVVRQGGDDLPPYGTTDLLVRLGATMFVPVHATPGAGEVQLDIPTGTLTFPSPLPASGVVELGYFVGLWEIQVERFTATLLVDIAHDDVDEHETLTAAVERALTGSWPPASGMRSIEQVGVAPAVPIAGLAAANRTQRLTFTVAVERVEPLIRTSGGPIRSIEIPIQPFGEGMEIHHE
jgi:hypothetical protein